MNKCKINYFISQRNENPIKDFLNQHPQTKLKAFRLFQLIEKYGLNSAIPHLKKIENTPLWEIKPGNHFPLRIR